MRIWSLHPSYLDPIGLIACWRETLLCKNVLLGNTRGYTNHPQAKRFKEHEEPVLAINLYLDKLYDEACERKYKFNKDKVGEVDRSLRKIWVTEGQLKYELDHLRKKLFVRNTYKYHESFLKFGPSPLLTPKQHPIFEVKSGGIESWEKISDD